MPFLIFLFAALACAQTDDRPNDDRSNLEASAHLGVVIDTFAARQLQTYLNPEANAAMAQRGTFGIRFGYRLNDAARSRQLWIFGETEHTSRSQDVNCAAEPNTAVCGGLTGNAVTGRAIYMLRNATALQSSIGVRFELLGLHPRGDNQGTVYLKSQTGFVVAAGGSGDALQNSHAAMGLLITGGTRKGSYLEAGYGRSGAFQIHRGRRLRIDGLLEQGISTGIALFMRMLVDADAGPGADSVQSEFGVSIDLARAGTLLSKKP